MPGKRLSLPDIIIVAAAAVAIFGAASGAYRGIRNLYRRTIGSRRDLARRLNQLAAGVSSGYVEARFGAPAFVRPFGVAFRELIYREKYTWLQTIVDDSNSVVRFSITVTDPRFRFQTRDLTFGHMSVKLGRSRFADLHTWASTDGRSLRIGAHNHEYAESYYFGNPGNYQHYVISKNDAAAGEFGYAIERAGHAWVQEGFLQFGTPPRAANPEWEPQAPYAIRFRAETTINTLTVLGPLQPISLLAEPRGPDTNQVRVLVPTPRERRRTRRLIRRANRQMARVVAREQLDDRHPATGSDDLAEPSNT